MQTFTTKTATETVHEVTAPPVLSIIIPTFNEALNLPELFERLLAFVKESNLSVETIVVDDDSPDGTGVLAEELAIRHDGWLRVRVLHRPAKLGLSSALYDGIRASTGAWIAMLDADNSHDIATLRDMLHAAQAGADVVVGSRYVTGGRIEDWPLHRRIISIGATLMTRALFDLRVHDPMSGFAVFRRGVAERLPSLSNPKAYKFLLELLVRVRPLEVSEIPIVFTNRANGNSKFSINEMGQFLRLVIVLCRERGSPKSAA